MSNIEFEPQEVRKVPEIMESTEIPIADGSLVFVIGVPGSGKSTFAHSNFPQESIVSPDALRESVSNNTRNQLVSDKAFRLAGQITRSRLKNGETVVIDAMNLSIRLRADFVNIAHEFDSKIVGILFDLSPEQIYQQNREREKDVEEEFLKEKLQEYPRDLRFLYEDKHIDSLYRITEQNRNKARTVLSPKYAEKLQVDRDFDIDAKNATSDLVSYFKEGRLTETEGLPRITVAAGSTNFIIKTEQSNKFLSKNLLPSQIVDIEDLAKRLGTSIEDPAVAETALALLTARASLNLISFTSYPETSQSIASALSTEMHQRFNNAHSIDATEETLDEAVLEIKRNVADDTPLLLVSDLHGCATALKELSSRVFKENIVKGKNYRKILFTGDIADRGPKNAEAILFMTALVYKREATWVLGNHDVNLLQGLEWVVDQFKKSGTSWNEYLAKGFDKEVLHDIVKSGETRKSIAELLELKSDGQGNSSPRLKASSIEKIIDVLSKAPTYKEYQHLVAVHASLPKIPRTNVPLTDDETKAHTHGTRTGKWRNGHNEVHKIRNVVAKDPDRLLVAGHTHEDGVLIDPISGTINLDAMAEFKGKVYGMYYPELEVVEAHEPSVIKLYEQLTSNELPRGKELVAFVDYLRTQGMIEVRSGRKDSIYSDLSVISYSDTTEFSNLWDTYPSLRNFRGLIIDGEGEIIARPFKKTHKAGVEIPLDQLEFVPDKVFEKANGSMGIGYFYKGDWHIATKFSFESDMYTKPSKEMLENFSNKEILDPSKTYLFEIILPEDPHFVDYGGEKKLVLLNVNDKETGEEMPWDQVTEAANQLGAQTAQDMTENLSGMTIREIYEHAQTEGNFTNLEGLMTQYVDSKTGERVTVKIKTKEYDQKKFVRDSLKWKRIMDRFDWEKGDMSSEQKDSLLSYNSNDTFVASALNARVEWIKSEYINLTEGIQNFIVDIVTTATNTYDAHVSNGMEVSEAIKLTMPSVVTMLSKSMEKDALPFPKNARNSILGLIRGKVSQNPQASKSLTNFAMDSIKSIIDKETKKRGSAAYWLVPTPEDGKYPNHS